MGTHHNGTGKAHTPSTTPGPRQTAARHRKRRALLMASATGAALLVATTATAALIATGTQPEQATQAATTPRASTNPLDPAPDHNNNDNDNDRDPTAEPTPHEPATATAQGPAVAEEPQPEQDTPEPSDNPDDSDEPGSQPTGEGGTCQASFYGDGFHGSTTANGETFDTHAMTAAHKTLPFNTKVEVTNPSNGQSVTVRINDRGPYIDGRCLDLSTAAFDQVIGTGAGVGTVDWQVVQ